MRVVALPGGGILTARTSEPVYLASKPLAPAVAGNVLHAASFEYQITQYQALVPINTRNGERTLIPDIVVVPGRTQHIRIVGPDGRPVMEARGFGHLRRARVGGEQASKTPAKYVS